MINYNDRQFRVLGICAAGIQQENVSELVYSIVRSASSLGLKSLIFSTFTDMYKKNAFAAGEAGIYSLIDNDMLDAVIVLPESIKDDSITESIIDRAAERGVPVVSIDRQTERCVSVLFNYGDSFENVVRHVITEHGCRRINFVAGMKGNSFSEERIDRFRKVLAEEGLEFDERRLGYGDFWSGPTRALAESWFTSGIPLPEAVICANDAMAIEVCRVLKEHGVRVPDDMIVTGFDGIELEKYHTPRLTTCAVDINEAGMAAVGAAIRLINGESCPPVLAIPYKPRISQSCGCSPVNMNIIADKVMELNNEIVRDDGHESYMFTYLARGLACSDVSKLAEVMHHYCDTQTWCCIDIDYFSDKRSRRRFGGAFTKQMQLIMYTVDHSLDNKVFDTELLLPELGKDLNEFDSMMFCPLHYEAELIGYMVFHMDLERTIFRNTRRFVLLTNQILESFRNRMLIERANAKLADMHIHDPMTGLLNRRGFYKTAAKLTRRLNKTNASAVVFSVDMDNLKTINDTFGHNEGDKAIKALASSLVKCSSEGDICSRFGGDEFIVLSENTDDEYISDYERRVNELLSEHTRRTKAPYTVLVSIGSICTRFSSADGLDECIRLADERMYDEKKRHKRSESRR